MAATMPSGKNARRYHEIRMLTKAYAQKLLVGDESYGAYLDIVDRMVELRDEAVKLWGGRS